MTLNGLTEHLELLTTTHTTRSSSGRGRGSKLELTGIKKLRELILELAVRGKLVPQNPEDEPASVLLERIAAEKGLLVKEKKIKKQKPLSPVAEDEKPFDLPAGWEWVRLGNISQINPKNQAEDSIEASFVPMPLITTSHDGNHGQEIKPWEKIKKGYTHFADGDVALAKITPCFENSKAAVFRGLRNGIGSGTTELHVARPYSSTIEPLYVLLYLKAPQFLLVGETKMTGSAGQKRVPKDFFAGNPLPLPPLVEQGRVVTKVNELMTLCDQLEQDETDSIAVHQALVDAMLTTLTDSKNAKELAENWSLMAQHFDTLFTTDHSIEQLKQTILQLAVMGRLVPQNDSDEPASVLLERIATEKARLVKEKKIKKQKPLPAITDEEKPFELPAGWEWCRFGSLVNIKSELVKSTEYPDFDQVAPDSIEKGTGRLLERRTVQAAGVKGPNNRFYSGQVLYSKIRPSLSKAVVAEFDGLCSADMYPMDSMINSQYLLKIILSEVFLQQVKLAENRIKMPKLNIESLSNILVPLACTQQHERIATKVNELATLCNTLKSQIHQTQTTQYQLATAIVEEAIG